MALSMSQIWHQQSLEGGTLRLVPAWGEKESPKLLQVAGSQAAETEESEAGGVGWGWSARSKVVKEEEDFIFFGGLE